MSKLVVTKANGDILEFENTIGHQIGNGAVQVMLGDGTQYVFNNFIEVFIDLDEEEKGLFKDRIAQAEANAAAKMAEQGKAEMKGPVAVQ